MPWAFCAVVSRSVPGMVMTTFTSKKNNSLGQHASDDIDRAAHRFGQEMTPRTAAISMDLSQSSLIDVAATNHRWSIKAMTPSAHRIKARGV